MHHESPQLDPLVGAYYERVPEESRLEVGAFRLEEARTRELVLRHAASPPARILDLGGAAGAYAFWLAERGYEAKQTLRISTSSSSYGWRKKLRIGEGSLVFVDNQNGKLNITRSAANDDPERT